MTATSSNELFQVKIGNYIFYTMNILLKRNNLQIELYQNSRTSVQMDGTLPKISFLKLQGGGGGSNSTQGLDGGRWYGLRP